MRPYDGTEKYIFISYAHKDSKRVLPLIEGLAQAGFRVWFDEGIEAGAEWPMFVEDRLDGCDKMVYFVTEASVESKNCRNEVNLALESGKEVLVAYLDRTKLKYGMRLQLSSSQSIFRDKFADDADFLRSITEAKILSECREDVGSYTITFGEPDPRPTPAVSEKQVKEWNAEGDRLYNQKKYDEAVEYYRRAAEQGHAPAQSNLGLCYENGTGVAKDATQAVYWYRKAAEQGDAVAQCNLGLCYENGTGVAKDATQAVYWYRKAAEQGDAVAQCNLGLCYKNGTGVTRDAAQAVAWYRKAVEQGNASAQNNLGYCYNAGIGIAKDATQAVYWYRKAAEQGNARAQYNLGVCYDIGTGVAKDATQAVYWYRKAAEQGNAWAQCNLGFCYQYGRGVTADKAQAIAWYRKAAEQGYANAKKKLEELT